jgi:hypothetical protein
METQTKSKTSAKDFIVNLGAIVALGIVVENLISLLFTIINKAYPLTTGYNYYGSNSISWPVASLIIFFPVYILLMWFLERVYSSLPEQRHMGIRKWLTYITLFFAGLAIAGDLVTVLYYFIDGQDITTGFIMKAISVLVVALGIFFYYISDSMGKLNAKSRKVWTSVALVIILGSVVWGFSVLGSPRTQQLLKYDEQRISDLQNINNEVTNYYSIKGTLPKTIKEMSNGNYYIAQLDPQNQKPYEYEKTSDTTYNLCAEFNKESPAVTQPNAYMRPIGYESWIHPAGRHCFTETINPNTYSKPVPIKY